MSNAKKKVRKIFVESLSEIGDNNSWMDSLVAIWPSTSWDNNTRNHSYIVKKYNVNIPKQWKAHTRKILAEYFMEILDIYVNEYVDPDCPSKLLSMKKWINPIKMHKSFANSDKTFQTFVKNLHTFTHTHNCNIFNTHKPTKLFKKRHTKIYSPDIRSKKKSSISSLSTVSPLLKSDSRSHERFDYVSFLKSTSLTTGQHKELQEVAAKMFRFGPVASFAYIQDLDVEGNTRKGYMMFWRHLILYLFSNFRLASACSAINNLAFQLRNSIDDKYSVDWLRIYPDLNMKEFTAEFERVKNDCIAITCSREVTSRRSPKALSFEIQKSPGITCRNPSKLKHALTDWELKILRAVPDFKKTDDMEEWVDRFIERAKQKIKTDTSGAGWKSDEYASDEDYDEDADFGICPRTTEFDRLSEIIRDRLSKIEEINLELVKLMSTNNVSLEKSDMNEITSLYIKITECQDHMYHARGNELKKCIDSTNDEYRTTIQKFKALIHELNNTSRRTTQTHDNKQGWMGYMKNVFSTIISTTAGISKKIYNKVTSIEKTKWTKYVIRTAFTTIIIFLLSNFTIPLNMIISVVLMLVSNFLHNKIGNKASWLMILYNIYQACPTEVTIRTCIYFLLKLIPIIVITTSSYFNVFNNSVHHTGTYRSWNTEQSISMLELSKRLRPIQNYNLQGDERTLYYIFNKYDVRMNCDNENGICRFEIVQIIDEKDVLNMKNLGFKLPESYNNTISSSSTTPTHTYDDLLKGINITNYNKHSIAIIGIATRNNVISEIHGVNSKGLLFTKFFNNTSFFNNVNLKLKIQKYGTQAVSYLKQTKKDGVSLQDVIGGKITDRKGVPYHKRYPYSHELYHDNEYKIATKIYNILKGKGINIEEITNYVSCVGIENPFKNIVDTNNEQILSTYVSLNNEHSNIPSENILNKACLTLFAIDKLSKNTQNEESKEPLEESETKSETSVLQKLLDTKFDNVYSCSDNIILKENGNNVIFGGLKVQDVMDPHKIVVLMHWLECLIRLCENKDILRSTDKYNLIQYKSAKQNFINNFKITPEEWLQVEHTHHTHPVQRHLQSQRHFQPQRHLQTQIPYFSRFTSFE